MALFLGTRLISDVTTPVVTALPPTIMPGDTPVLYSIGRFSSTNKNEYTEIEESAITIPRAGTYRIKFSCVNLYNTSLQSNAYVQLYVNHEQTRTEGILVPKYSSAETFEYSQDITLEYGDVVTIAIKAASTTYSTMSMGIIACIDWENGF